MLYSIQEDDGFLVICQPFKWTPPFSIVPPFIGKKIEKLDTDDLDEIEKIAS